MTRNEFERACADAHAGKISVSTFFRVTEERWRGHAHDLATLYLTSIKSKAHAEEDIFQDLQIGAWKYLPKFDATRSESVGRFLTYNAFAYAKKAIHRALGRKSRATAERAEYVLREMYFRDRLDRARVDEQRHTNVEMEWRDVVVSVAKVNTTPKHLAILSFGRTESLAAAASLLYVNVDARRLCGLTSKAHAQKFVTRIVIDEARKRKREREAA
jgi:hypothetical protein